VAFQGGSFLAGAVDTGVVRALTHEGVFETHDVCAFSGTSAGALVAAVCWSSALEGRIGDAQDVLEKLWLHNASGTIPSQEWGDFWKSFDKAARQNPLYDFAAESVRTPWLHAKFKEWVQTYIETRKAVDTLYNRKDDQARPRLALGSADVLEGEIVTFSDQAFIDEVERCRSLTGTARDAAIEAGAQLMLDALMASGSLDEVNGMTTIESGANQGTYLDGAWGQNPPIEAMIDFGVDEIWIVEVFPKFRQRVPKTLGERDDRKEELWQNSLVEQQVHMIRRVNEWLGSGRLFRDYRDYAKYLGLPVFEETDTADERDRKRKECDVRIGQLAEQHVKPVAEAEFKRYRHIEVRRMPMTLDFTPGARIVNSESFLRDKMHYGYENALHFLNRIDR
jgi:NTE family protein